MENQDPLEVVARIMLKARKKAALRKKIKIESCKQPFEKQIAYDTTYYTSDLLQKLPKIGGKINISNRQMTLGNKVDNNVDISPTTYQPYKSKQIICLVKMRPDYSCIQSVCKKASEKELQSNMSPQYYQPNPKSLKYNKNTTFRRNH